ncbi:MAG: VWA domain-containing protein [Pyrinomonadaceae bacterium]|nr:VWA domain-containing protein [Pyrinomonadaceae bacterium]
MKIVPKIEFLLERAQLEAGRDQTVDVLVRITPPDTDSVIGRRPKLNFGIVLDRSGSMGGEKMERAREAASYCIDQLLPVDRLSLVIFDDVIEVLIPSQLAEHKAALKERLAHIYARNSTALHEAWVRGGMQVSEHLTDGAINRVLLITDGQANVGLTNTDEIVTQAMGLFQRGVSTSTIGIGEDFQEDLLMPMAQSAGGNAWHVKRAEDLQRIFSIELEGLIAQVAHTVTLGLIPSDGVRLSDVLNDFEMNETGRYKLPNLQAGSSVDVLVQLRVPAQAAGTKRHLLDLRVGYTPQEAASAEVVKQSLEVEFAETSSVKALPVNEEVEKVVRMLMNARARREAMAHMDRGDYVMARQVVTSALSASMPLFNSPAATPEVMEERQQLEEIESSLTNRSEDKMTRKRLFYESYLRRNSKRQ